ncbi:MAG: hypothetical protein E7812_11620 [Phenylobacterium sp.]|nr:MAG: hypothetical protein E7812_11620 [Phenylobacterium sp.]
MLLEFLAAAATVAAPPTAPTDPSVLPPKTLSPLIVTAQPKVAPPADATVAIDSDDDAPGAQHVSVWPAGAWASKINGHVTLTCFVDIHGLAERCRVAYETPQGRGFGAAALELQPTLKVTPLKGADGQPVAANMNIALNFKAPDTQQNIQDLALAAGTSGQMDVRNLQLSKNPTEMRRVVMMNHPVWVQAPSFDDLAQARPVRAGVAEGYAVAHCEVARSGELVRCVASKELPGGAGFAPAAVKLAAKFRISPEVMKYAPHGAPIEVDVPIRFPAAGEAADRTVTAPSWISGVDPETAPRLFPPEAAAKGVTSGRGMAKCLVTPDGTLADCAPESADPDGLGFSEAAVKLAATMRMNLWSSDAEPVEGGVVHVAIRLNLNGSDR